MEHRAVYEGELELRQKGRRLAGRFSLLAEGPVIAMATVMNRGKSPKRKDRPGRLWLANPRVRKAARRACGDASFNRPPYDEARVQVLRQELERRNIHVLAGHSYDRPMGDMLRSGARVTSTREAVEFEIELPDESNQPVIHEGHNRHDPGRPNRRHFARLPSAATGRGTERRTA